MSKEMLQADKRNEIDIPDRYGLRIRPGDRVGLHGSHPHAGRIGTYKGVEYLQVPGKFAALVRFDDGQGCYVFHARDWIRIQPDRMSRKGGNK